MSGSYRLSAYFLAKGFSELPLALILPTASYLIFYSMAALNGVHVISAFFGSWFIYVSVGITAQSLGESVARTPVRLRGSSCDVGAAGCRT